jgi:hypothetical protein
VADHDSVEILEEPTMLVVELSVGEAFWCVDDEGQGPGGLRAMGAKP